MGDVINQTDNFTLYDESGNQLGTNAAPLISKSASGAYDAVPGTSVGTVSVPTGSRVTGISCASQTSGSATIQFTNSLGALRTITVPGNFPITLNPQGLLVGPVDIIFSGSIAAYVVEMVT